MKTVINEAMSNEKASFSWDDLEEKPISENNPNTIGDFLAGYKDIEPAPVNTETITEQPPANVATPVTPSNNWEKDPNYNNVNDPRFFYQSGAKKGQRRKNPKMGITYTPPQGQTAVLSGALLTGAIFITLIDLLFPLLICVINNQFSKVKIDPDKLKLTDKQKKELEPVSDAVVKYINFEANPILLLALGMGGIYGMNFYMVKETEKSKLKNK